MRTVQHFGTIVVVGGGCYGSYYLRQLSRASEAGALTFERIAVVDQDPQCRVARAKADAARAAHGGSPRAGIGTAADYTAAGGPPRRDDATTWDVAPHHFAAVDVVCAPWEQFLPAFLDDAADHPERHDTDAVVPSPLMPHLTHEWLVARSRRRWPDRPVASPPLPIAPTTPWQRTAATGGAHYVSFAEWMCPINCIEPPRCPETRGPRSWSMPVAARAYVDDVARRGGNSLVGPLLFHCEHRAYGVGMFDARAAAVAATELDAAVARAADDETVRALVASVSHCHGAWSVVEIGPRA